MRIFYFPRKKTWLLIGAVLIILLLIVGLIGGSRNAVYTSSASEKKLPIYQVDTETQSIAISFDASWGAEYTGDILDILDEYQVKATFFLVNVWLEDYPDLAAEIAGRGHEIGLHSTTHPKFTGLSQAQMVEELTNNYSMVKQVTGYDAKLFRCPYGDYNSTVVSVVEDSGYICVQWSIDSWDWMDLSAAEISKRVLADPEAGDIILMHNNGLHTAEALPEILRELKARGLQPVPVGELLLEGDWYVDNNGIQHLRTNTD